jgi:hypothetical protein
MNCHECRRWIDDLLLRDPDEAPPADVAQHLDDCADCAREHALALETLEALTPRALAVASPRLKARILAAIPDATLDGTPSETAVIGPRRAVSPWKRRAVRMRLAIALAAAVLLALILFPFWSGLSPSRNGGAFDLLARAEAAEARLFVAADVVGLASEIVVEPVPDAVLAEARWLPLVSVGADGKPRFHELKLGGDPKAGYTIRDESWFDPATRRFAHVLILKDRPLFANSYDGRSVRLLEVDEQGQARIKDEPVAPGFQPPKDPAEVLGIFAFVKGSKEQFDRTSRVRDDGSIKLADGTSARVLRLTFLDGDSAPGLDSYLRVTIRDDSHRVESLELVAAGKRLYTVRRTEASGPREPRYGWDLAGLRPAIEKKPGGNTPPVKTFADLVRPNVTVEELAKRADYPVYVLGRDPSWSARRQIVDILDVASPPHRMFAAVYPAKDKRHIVLMQARTFNANLGPLARAGKLLYTSPAGVKVWSGKNDRQMAEILLTSMAASGQFFSGPPAADRTCYLLETPEGTFPALAVNGTLTDAELHGLVDSLVRARPK